MLQTLVWISLGDALCLSPMSALAQTGYGVSLGAPVYVDLRPVVDSR